MARKHGITANTYKYFAIDQGAVYVNYGEAGQALLGATRGGNTFTVEQDMRNMEVDGAKGEVKGGKRITAVRPIIVANFVEIDKTILNYAFPGSTVADYPSTPAKTHDGITRDIAIATTDYLTNIAIVGECSGTSTGYIECVISNVLSEGNFEMSWAPNDESVIAVTFKGHFDPSDLETEPWTIRFPVIS